MEPTVHLPAVFIRESHMQERRKWWNYVSSLNICATLGTSTVHLPAVFIQKSDMQ